MSLCLCRNPVGLCSVIITYNITIKVDEDDEDEEEEEEESEDVDEVDAETKDGEDDDEGEADVAKKPAAALSKQDTHSPIVFSELHKCL